MNFDTIKYCGYSYGFPEVLLFIISVPYISQCGVGNICFFFWDVPSIKVHYRKHEFSCCIAWHYVLLCVLFVQYFAIIGFITTVFFWTRNILGSKTIYRYHAVSFHLNLLTYVCYTIIMYKCHLPWDKIFLLLLWILFFHHLASVSWRCWISLFSMMKIIS